MACRRLRRLVAPARIRLGQIELALQLARSANLCLPAFAAAAQCCKFGTPGKSVRRSRIASSRKRTIFCFTEVRIRGLTCPSPRRLRDVSRSSRNVVRVAMDACRVRWVHSRRTKTRRRTAKSCGPGAATVASIHAALWWRGNGDKNRRSPGRSRISRKPLRGESRDVLAVPVVQPVCSLATGLSHTGLRAQSAPGFPCVLFKEEGHQIA